MDRPVSHVGEWALIDAIRAHLPGPPDGEVWSGDDAAVLAVARDKIVFTTDVLVERVDFDLSYSPPESIGAKTIAANASDVAAMGARPRWAVATVTLPPHTPARVVDELARGMAREAGEIGAALVGGDISQGRDLIVSAAMIGEVEGRAVTRAGAQVGDVVCVTGALGGAAGGLLLLREGGANEERGRRLVERQLAPHARSEAGPLLASHATAMIDVSDGLAADLAHVLDASGVGCRIDDSRIPIDPDLAGIDLPQGVDALDLALAGGEDFELLFTVAPDDERDVLDALEASGTPCTAIGEITERGRIVGDRNLDSWKDKGWQHLQPR